MTDRLQRPADTAIETVSKEAVVAADKCFALVCNGTPLSFFMTKGDTGAFRRRAMIGSLGEGSRHCELSEDALEDSLFWRATEGTPLPLNDAEITLYLTYRLDNNMIYNKAVFADYPNGFLQSVHRWQASLENLATEKGA